MQYQADIDAILARRHDNEGDYWASSDGRVYFGSPFSTIQCALILSDLGLRPRNPAILRASTLFMDCCREDERFKLAPNSSIYPCHTTGAAKVLCRVGYARHDRIERVVI